MPTESVEKFKRGDVVHVPAEMPENMRHFPCDADGVVIGSGQQYNAERNGSYQYTILFEEYGETSWYQEGLLTFIRHGGQDEIDRIKALIAAREIQESDMTWILSNWPRIRHSGVSGATVGKLADLIHYGDLAPHGEGFEYYANAEAIIGFFDAALLTGTIEAVEAQVRKLEEYEFFLSHGYFKI